MGIDLQGAAVEVGPGRRPCSSRSGSVRVHSPDTSYDEFNSAKAADLVIPQIRSIPRIHLGVFGTVSGWFPQNTLNDVLPDSKGPNVHTPILGQTTLKDSELFVAGAIEIVSFS